MYKATGNRIVVGVLLSILAACAKPPMPLTAPMPAAANYPAAASMTGPVATSTAPKPTASAKPKAPAAKPTAVPANGKAPAAAKPVAAKPTGPSAAEAVAQLRADVQALADKTENFISQVTSWNVGKGEKQSCTVAYAWSKPNQTSIEILDSSQSSNIGVKILWGGAETCKIRAKVLGIPIKADLPIADPRLANKRGYTFADTSINTWQRNILDPNGQITIRGKQVLPNGKEAIVFDCLSSYMQPGITKEIYGLDTQTKAPLLLQMYEGETCVYEVQVKTVDFNVTLPADTFQL